MDITPSVANRYHDHAHMKLSRRIAKRHRRSERQTHWLETHHAQKYTRSHPKQNGSATECLIDPVGRMMATVTPVVNEWLKTNPQLGVTQCDQYFAPACTLRSDNKACWKTINAP